MDRTKANLATIRETAKRYPWFSEATIRDKVYHSRERMSARGEKIPPNGFARCVVKLDHDASKRGQILIDLDQLDAWIEEHRCAPIAEPGRAAA